LPSSFRMRSARAAKSLNRRNTVRRVLLPSSPCTPTSTAYKHTSPRNVKLGTAHQKDMGRNKAQGRAREVWHFHVASSSSASAPCAVEPRLASTSPAVRLSGTTSARKSRRSVVATAAAAHWQSVSRRAACGSSRHAAWSSRNALQAAWRTKVCKRKLALARLARERARGERLEEQFSRLAHKQRGLLCHGADVRCLLHQPPHAPKRQLVLLGALHARQKRAVRTARPPLDAAALKAGLGAGVKAHGAGARAGCWQLPRAPPTLLAARLGASDVVGRTGFTLQRASQACVCVRVCAAGHVAQALRQRTPRRAFRPAAWRCCLTRPAVAVLERVTCAWRRMRAARMSPRFAARADDVTTSAARAPRQVQPQP